MRRQKRYQTKIRYTFCSNGAIMEIRLLSIDDYDSIISLWKSAKLPFKPKGRDKKEKIRGQLKKDPDLKNYLREEELLKIFDLNSRLKNIDHIFKKVGLD